jgi:hypothetical protein
MLCQRAWALLPEASDVGDGLAVVVERFLQVAPSAGELVEGRDHPDRSRSAPRASCCCMSRRPSMALVLSFACPPPLDLHPVTAPAGDDEKQDRCGCRGQVLGGRHTNLTG